MDAPWANHTHELAASENFLFQPFHDDANIASDFSEGQSGFTFDAAEFLISQRSWEGDCR
ncbi:MAG: hypothetical protein ACLR6I_19485 [Waltera sp.]